MNRPLPLSQVCEQGLHHQCQGHDTIGGCRCPDRIHTVTPADELRAAVQLLRDRCNCLPNALLLADLLDAISAEMDEDGAVEGTASKAVHPMTIFGVGHPDRAWTAALAMARAQPGIEEVIARSVNGTTGGTP